VKLLLNLTNKISVIIYINRKQCCVCKSAVFLCLKQDWRF